MNPTHLIRCLAENGVEAVLVGAMAAQARGAPTQTQDIDFCYNPAPENKGKIVAALAPYNPRLRKEGLDDSAAPAEATKHDG